MSCQVNVGFVGETSIVFSETWVNYKMFSILTVILRYYKVHQTSIITFRFEFKL